MFERVFKNIDDVLWKEAGCSTELNYTELNYTELNYTEQTSRVAPKTAEDDAPLDEAVA